MPVYTPTTWVDDDGSGNGTLITATRMNNIESGLQSAHTAINAGGGGTVADGSITWKKLDDPARSVPMFSRMSVFGHSLPAGGGATDPDRDMMTHVASMLDVRELNYSRGGAILHWHNAEPDTAGNGGYAAIFNNHKLPLRASTTVGTATAGPNSNVTTLVTAAATGAVIKTNDVINVGTGTNGETTYAIAVSGTTLTLSPALQNAHAVGEPVQVIPSEYIAGNPLFVPWIGLNDLQTIDPVALQERFQPAYRSVITRLRSAEFIDNTSTAFTKTGTWTEASPTVAPAYSGIATYGTYSIPPTATSSTLTWHVPANYPGTELAMYFVIGGGQATITFTVDGVTHNPSLPITTSQIFTGKYNVVCKRFTGLAAGRHTIVATIPAYAGGEIGFDGASIGAEQPPLVVCPNINRPLNYSQWATSPNSPTSTTIGPTVGSTANQASGIPVVNAANITVGETVTFDLAGATKETRRVTAVNTTLNTIATDTGLTYAHPVGHTVLSGMQDADIPTMNAYLQSTINEFTDGRVTYFDVDAVVNKNPAYFFYDGAHFNDRGHAEIASAIVDHIYSATSTSVKIPAHTSVPTNPLPSEIVVIATAGSSNGTTASGVWTAQPAALTELFGSVAYRQVADLKRAKEWRWYCGVHVVGKATAPPASLRVQYSINQGTTWTYLDRTIGSLAEDTAMVTRPMELSLGTAGFKTTGWHDIPVAAMTDATWLRIVGINGNATIAPAIPNITIQFR